MPWNYRRFGSAAQPIHKSDLAELSGKYACAKRFRFKQDEAFSQARGEATARERPRTVSAKVAFGTAVHEVLARVLSNADACGRLLHAGELPERRFIECALEEELERAAEGRGFTEDADADKLFSERVEMLLGVLASVPSYVAQVLAVEVGFAVELDGYHYAGHIDLVFRPTAAPDTIALADWKTGATKPHPLELSHGWESGIYSLALSRGAFLRRAIATTRLSCSNGELAYEARCGRHSVIRASRWQAERDAFEAALIALAHGRDEPGAFGFAEFPSAIYHVHLGDFVPYQKAGRRLVSRPDELGHYGLPSAQSISYKAGDARGPGWLRVQRHERDIPRLAHRARIVVGTVRMGRFLDVVDDRCTRCAYTAECLNEGYAPTGDELAVLESTLKEAGL